jgi:hypothetical protein
MPRRAHAQSLFDSRIDIADRQRRHCDLLLLRAREEEGGKRASPDFSHRLDELTGNGVGCTLG